MRSPAFIAGTDEGICEDEPGIAPFSIVIGRVALTLD
jgi:hypothetical protein